MPKQPPYTLRYRQVHLDFHTSPHIEGIGEGFDAKAWQKTLTDACVDSITCFATCHHGYSYYDTKVGERHPHLKFDLLRKQVDACKAVDINVPIYLTGGINNWASARHPEWREIDHEGRYTGWAVSPLDPGYHKMCFNSPYLQLLCDQIREVVTLFPDGDGIFIDIIRQSPCCCDYCLRSMHDAGLDPKLADDRVKHAARVMRMYYEQTTAAARSGPPDMPIFHNSSHVTPGRTDLLPFFSHLELESLPTGGWGYDHFPLSARYVAQLPLDALGMTGKFHNSWGEFGGYKHPNALRYECAAMIAHGTKCSVGDQLHPSSRLDPDTYAIIGAAYREVKAKEPYCDHADNVADIGLLCSAAFHHGPGRERHADTGASRLLLESHFLFNVLDAEMDFSPYRLLILPDDIPVNDGLHSKLQRYLDAGGRLLLSGHSALSPDGKSSRFDLGAELLGPSPYEPDYAVFREDLQPDFCSMPHVMYHRSQRLRCNRGTSLGDVYDPYFNRSYRHFSSHQHTPPTGTPSGYHLGVQHGPVTYLAHPLFTMYAAYGSVAYKQVLTRVIRSAMGVEPTFESNLPSTARVTLTHQPGHKRYVLHLLYATKTLRGGAVPHPGSTNRASYPLQVIEELTPIHGIESTLRSLPRITRVHAPFSEQQPVLEMDGNLCRIKTPKVESHELVVLEYA